MCIRDRIDGRPLIDDVVVIAARLLPTALYGTRNVAGDVARAAVAPPLSRATRR